MAGTPSGLLDSSAEDLNQVFAHSPAGPMPSGVGRGTAILAPGSPIARALATITKMLFWQGKVFDDDRHDMLNLLSPFSLRAVRAQVYESESWVDHEPCIVLDYARSSLFARTIRDEIRMIDDGEYLGIVFVARWRLPVRFHLAFPTRQTTEH